MTGKCLNIFIFTNVMGVGGTDRQVLYIANQLNERGHNVKIMSLRPPREMGYEAVKKGLNYSTLDVSDKVSVLSALVQLRRELNEFEPDVLSCFLYHSNIIGRVFGTVMDIPVIVTSLRNENLGGWLRPYVIRMTNKLDDVVTTNSQTVENSLVKRKIVPDDHIVTIHNAIDTDHFHPDVGGSAEIRNELHVDEETFLWITVGRLNQQKNHKSLVAALSGLDGNYKVIIVGDGHMQTELMSMARDLGVKDRILFLNERQDVNILLAASDAFVLPSAWEGLPNVVMEAASSALPVVSTQVGGVEELLLDGKSGYLVPKNNPKALQGSMATVMDLSEKDRSQMGRIGRKHMVKNFSICNIIDDWEYVYSCNYTCQ